VIADNEVAVKDTLRNLESFTATLAANGDRITGFVDRASSGVDTVDGGLTKTQAFLAGLGSDKYGGQLLPTVISFRELIQSFDKRSGAMISDARKMLGDISQSINNSAVGRPAGR
jgi:phospholipid/cholesterol/gamma-HCH transport system substrate-binding protein